MDTNQSLEDCIEECRSCQKVCTEAAYRSLEVGGERAEKDHVTMLINCAAICATSAQFMMSGSELHTITSGACAQVCERCADECELLGDELFECVAACRSCADSCRSMASMASMDESPRRGSSTGAGEVRL